MKINGKDTELASPITVEELILNSGHRSDRVAVELNGKILPKAEYSTVYLKESDSVEIVGFVGGG